MRVKMVAPHKKRSQKEHRESSSSKGKGKGKGKQVATRIGPDGIQFSNEHQEKKYNKLAARTVVPTRRIDWSLLWSMDMKDTFEEIIRNMQWETLVNAEEFTYKHLVLEFLSSYAFDKKKEIMTFRVKNKEAVMSVVEVNALFDMADGGYKSSTECRDFSCDAAWMELTGEQEKYNSNVRITSVKPPMLRVLHRFLTNSLRARGVSSTWVSKEDLFLLWCAYKTYRGDAQFKVNSGWFLMERFSEIAAQGSGDINIGQFITIIAKSIGFVPSATDQQKIVPFEPNKHMIGSTILVALKLIRKIPRENMMGAGGLEWEPIKPANLDVYEEPTQNNGKGAGGGDGGDGEAEAEQAEVEEEAIEQPRAKRQRVDGNPSNSMIYAKLTALYRNVDRLMTHFQIHPVDPPSPPPEQDA